MARQTYVSPPPRISRKRRPNILYVMFDQLAPQFLPSYGHKVVKAPNLSRLAAEGVQFDSAYTNSPLCAPTPNASLAPSAAYRTASFFAMSRGLDPQPDAAKAKLVSIKSVAARTS